MKSLKLLNKKLLLNILFFLFLTLGLRSEEPVDIWNIEKKEKNQNEIKNNNLEADTITENNIYKMQSQNEDGAIIIEEDQTIVSKETKIVGLYDPAENGLDINMWANSNGDQILKIFDRISQIDLSQDAIEILNTLLVTNDY